MAAVPPSRPAARAREANREVCFMNSSFVRRKAGRGRFPVQVGKEGSGWFVSAWCPLWEQGSESSLKSAFMLCSSGTCYTQGRDPSVPLLCLVQPCSDENPQAFVHTLPGSGRRADGGAAAAGAFA